MLKGFFILVILFGLNILAVNAQPHKTLKGAPGKALPSPWKNRDIGAVGIVGHTDFYDKHFTVTGSGQYNDSTKDQFQYAYFPMNTEGELTVRIVPQPGSQLLQCGLTMRESLTNNAPEVSLLLSTGKSGQGDRTKWQGLQLSRSFAGKALQVKNAGEVLQDPLVTNGQLTGYYWLRLQRKFNSFYAFTSIDGRSWTSLGNTFVEMKKKFFAGIAVSSGNKKSAVTVIFDHVIIPGWTSED